MSSAPQLDTVLDKDEKLVVQVPLASVLGRIGAIAVVVGVLVWGWAVSWLWAGVFAIFFGGFFYLRYQQTAHDIALTNQRLLWLGPSRHGRPDIKREHDLEELLQIHTTEHSSVIELTFRDSETALLTIRGEGRAQMFAQQLSETGEANLQVEKEKQIAPGR